MATKGQYANFSVEQGWGTLHLHQVRRRGADLPPDRSAGPTARASSSSPSAATSAIATESTPVYERFFAGNFGSLRGFQYRTVSPHAFGVPTGGVMMAVGSVEYQFPWNAQRHLQPDHLHRLRHRHGELQFNDMRVSVGTGLKVEPPDDRPDAVRVRPGLPDHPRLSATSSSTSTSPSAGSIERPSGSGQPTVFGRLACRPRPPGTRPRFVDDRRIPARMRA